MFDIAVIGAGPAGATLARLLARRFTVALIEKRDLAGEREGADCEKCCGGLLVPEARRALGRLGLAPPPEVLVEPDIFTACRIDLASGREKASPCHYLNIDRLRFDRWLFRLVPDEVRRMENSLVFGIEPGRASSLVRCRRGGTEEALEARLVIGTDGACSRARAACAGSEDGVSRYFAVQEWFEVPESPPLFQAVIDPAITDFYAWTIPKNGALVVGAALDPHRDPLGRFSLLKEKLKARGLPLSRPFKKRSAFLLRPLSRGAIVLGAARFPGIALAGEAAGLVSPSSGEGLSFALESARLLASALLEHGFDFKKAYAGAAASLRNRIFLKNLKARWRGQAGRRPG